MPTISRPRPTLRTNSAARSASATTSASCRKCPVRFSTRARSSSATGASSTGCSVTAKPNRIGTMASFALATPGHTPACMTHVIGDAAFVGDTLFMPDGGTARADFPGGDPHRFYRSIRKILSLPDEMRLFVCHDYGPHGRDICWQTTVAEERRNNIHVRDGVSEEDFVALRTSRDRTLGMPKL